VTIVIINNSMVMATMDRVAEIGTMRAIGASRRTVMNMVLTETVVLGLLAGGLGALFGAGTVTWLGRVGIPAGTTDILIFLFAGPRLHPSVGLSNLVIGVVIIMIVSVVSTLYPARLASRIQPVVAMQGKD
jgi:ABC-type antimicrobial peptide transport system permease subunit